MSPADVLAARDLIGKYRGEQVLGVHARKRAGGTFLPPRKRGSASAIEASQRQRVVNIGAASSAWTRISRAVFG